MASQVGMVFSKSKRVEVYIHEVIDSLDIPLYLKTSDKGVGYFIPQGKPLITLETTIKEVLRIAQREMSKVC
jgi:hypothetical protein